MKIGVSTASLYPEKLENSLKTLLENDVKIAEVFFNTESELDENYLNILNSLLLEYNAKVSSIHPFTSGYEPVMLFSDYKRRTKDSFKFYEKYFKAGQKLGATILVIHGDRRTEKMGGISDIEYFKTFKELMNLGEKYNITVAQENVFLYRSQHIDFIKKMKDYLGSDIKFVFDIKQAIRANQNPYLMCETMGQNLIHVHINDNDELNDCLLPGKGTMDYKKIFSMLNSFNYQGDCVIEVYKQNYNEVSQIFNSKIYLEKLLKLT